jgi:hypothetical protein
MKTVVTIVAMFTAGAAHAHDSLVPHTHPHGISMLPDVETFGIAALLLALAVIAVTYVKR